MQAGPGRWQPLHWWLYRTASRLRAFRAGRIQGPLPGGERIPASGPHTPLLYLAGGRLGDALLAAAFVRHYQAWFGRPVIAVGRPETAAVLAPLVERFVPVDPEAKTGPLSLAAAAAALPTEVAGVVGDLHLFHGSLQLLHLATARAQGPVVVYDGWIDRRLQAPFRPWPSGALLVPSLTKAAVSDAEQLHVWHDLVHYHRAMLDAFGLMPELPTEPWLPPALVAAPLGAFALPRNFVACPIESSQPKKDLDLRRWMEVWEACADIPFVLLGQRATPLPATADSARNGAAPRNVLDLRGQTSLTEAASVVAQSRLCLGVDSGLAHIAAIQRIPTLVAMAQATVGYFFPYPKPLARNVATILAEGFAACAGCGGLCSRELRFRWQGTAYPCLRELSAEPIATAVRLAWRETQLQPTEYGITTGAPTAGAPR